MATLCRACFIRKHSHHRGFLQRTNQSIQCSSESTVITTDSSRVSRVSISHYSDLQKSRALLRSPSGCRAISTLSSRRNTHSQSVLRSSQPLLFPTRLLTSEDECKWFWHQMIYFPGTINIVSTRLYCHTYITMNSLLVFQLCTSTYSVHAGILNPWRSRLPYPLVVFSSHYGSRLPSSYVRS